MTAIVEALRQLEQAGGRAELLPSGKAQVTIPPNPHARAAAAVLRRDPLSVRALLRDRMGDSLPALVADWPESLRDLYFERAAIRQYDGGADRTDAEREAEAEIRRLWAAGGVS